MKILAIECEVPGTTTEQCSPYLAAEATAAWRLYQEGVIRELYFRAEQSAAVLVLEGADAAEARETLATLPLVQAGLIAFELLPLRPYPGFARLFGAGLAPDATDRPQGGDEPR